MTNVALHANATQVDVLITYRNHHVMVVVEDNGIGFTTAGPAIEKQLGLFGMKERIEMLKGSFTLESARQKRHNDQSRGAGWQLKSWLLMTTRLFGLA